MIPMTTPVSTFVRSLGRLGCGLLAALPLIACGPPEPVVLGGIIPESGPGAQYGPTVRKGMELAVSEVNEAGGILRGRPIRIEWRDDSTLAGTAQAAARDLIDSYHVPAIVGGVTSAVGLGLVGLMNQREVPLISPSASSPRLTQAGGKWFFRVYPSDLAEGSTMANLCGSLGIGRAAMVVYNDPFGTGIAEVFGRYFDAPSREIVLREAFDGSLTPERARGIADRVQAAGPDAVYLAAYIDDVVTLLHALQQAGFRGVRLGTSAITPDVLRLVGPAAEKLVFPQPPFEGSSDDPQVKAFITSYQAKFHQAPNTFAAYGYDAVRVVVEAIERAMETTPDSIRQQLLEMNYRGVTGPIDFDEHGDVVKPPRLFVVMKDEIVRFEEFDRSIKGFLLQ